MIQIINYNINNTMSSESDNSELKYYQLLEIVGMLI
jgi:hypothetical protein